MHTNISASVLNFMLFLVQRMSLLLAPWRHADGHRERLLIGVGRKRPAHGQSDANDTPGAEINRAAHAND
jgi:hypothetical protein